MLISAARLVAVIADRLDPIAPPPFRVRAQGTDLAIDHPQSWGFTMDAGWIEDETETRTPAELADLIIGNALSGLQDAVSESSKEPWPQISPTIMALPNTRTDGERVFFWYGPSESTAVLGFPPIMLKDVTRP